MRLLGTSALLTVLGATCASALSPSADSDGTALQLTRVYRLPNDIKGSFDHLEVDLKRNRIFVAAEDNQAVLVVDLGSGEVVHRISGILRPHGLLYRGDVDRLYVTDGGEGVLRVFDGDTYEHVASVPLQKDADSVGFDISRKYLYVDSGGKDAGQSYSMLSGIDTNTAHELSSFRIESNTLEAMALDNYRPHLYVNDKANNVVVVVNRYTNSLIAKWPVTMGRQNVAMALDEQRQRLFVGCRSGQVVVLDSNTGRELQSLPIPNGIDDLIYDPGARRLYAITGGGVAVFQQTDLNHYASLGTVATGVNGRTGRLIPQLGRLFVAVPQNTQEGARILAYQPVHTPEPKSPTEEQRQQVNAPAAQNIVLETLSAHPLLRRMGLHAIPPGGKDMVIIANANATRVGIRTSQGDFDAVASGKIYGPRIADGEFYNMKMYLSDATGRRIGIIVMEIACTDASSEAAAAHEAAEIREEVQKRIPSLDTLFETSHAD